MFMDPQIHCYWDAVRGPAAAPSKFLLVFSWCTPHDSNDMNLTDTAMTLEHYVDWK